MAQFFGPHRSEIRAPDRNARKRGAVAVAVEHHRRAARVQGDAEPLGPGAAHGADLIEVLGSVGEGEQLGEAAPRLAAADEANPLSAPGDDVLDPGSVEHRQAFHVAAAKKGRSTGNTALARHGSS